MAYLCTEIKGALATFPVKLVTRYIHWQPIACRYLQHTCTLLPSCYTEL